MPRNVKSHVLVWSSSPRGGWQKTNRFSSCRLAILSRGQAIESRGSPINDRVFRQRDSNLARLEGGGAVGGNEMSRGGRAWAIDGPMQGEDFAPTGEGDLHVRGATLGSPSITHRNPG